jgi:hypothetical protein
MPEKRILSVDCLFLEERIRARGTLTVGERQKPMSGKTVSMLFQKNLMSEKGRFCFSALGNQR